MVVRRLAAVAGGVAVRRRGLGLGLGLAACSDSEPGADPPADHRPRCRAALPPLGFSDADDGRVGHRRRRPADHRHPPQLRLRVRAAVRPGGGAGRRRAHRHAGRGVVRGGAGVGVRHGRGQLRRRRSRATPPCQADRVTCAEPDLRPRRRPVAAAAARRSTATARTTTTLAPGSEVRGTVVFSPVCPVECDPPDPACAPRPGPATVELARPTASSSPRTARATTARSPWWSPRGPTPSRLRPPVGHRRAAASPTRPRSPSTPDTSTTVTVTCDTGIR